MRKFFRQQFSSFSEKYQGVNDQSGGSNSTCVVEIPNSFIVR